MSTFTAQPGVSPSNKIGTRFNHLPVEERNAAAVITARMESGVAFARDRVLAHLRSPAEFPLPMDARSFERALLSKVGPGHGRRRDNEIDAAIKRLRSTGVARTANYGELAPLDAHSVVSTGDQMLALKLSSPLTEAQQQALKVEAPRRLPVPGKLELTVHKLTCIDKTRHFPEIDGRDEIQLSASLTGVGVGATTREVFVGKFRKDDTHAVTPSPLLAVNVRDIAAANAAAIVSFDLVEKDRGNAPPAPLANPEALLEAFVFGAAGAVIFSGPSTWILLFEGAALGAATLPAVPVLAVAGAITALVAATVAVVRLFMRLGVDETYPDRTLDPVLLTAMPALSGKPQTVDFIAKRENHGFSGHYRLSYGWTLAKA
jgi:hypothetical protein